MTKKVFSGEQDVLLYIFRRSVKRNMPARTTLIRKINIYFEFTFIVYFQRKLRKPLTEVGCFVGSIHHLGQLSGNLIQNNLYCGKKKVPKLVVATRVVIDLTYLCSFCCLRLNPNPHFSWVRGREGQGVCK